MKKGFLIILFTIFTIIFSFGVVECKCIPLIVHIIMTGVGLVGVLITGSKL